jgi:hypothetical protein
MKGYFITTLTIFILGLILFTGCKKDDPGPEDTPTTTTTGAAPGGFTWTPSGGSAVVASDAYFIQEFSNIYGIKNGVSSSVDITLDTLSTGTHNISQSIGITLEYAVGTTTYTGKSGSVNITSKTATSISGNFVVALNGGTVTSISGEFVNLPKK